MKTLLFVFALLAPAYAATTKAGFARVNITPKSPIYLSGYAARKKPSEGVLRQYRNRPLRSKLRHNCSTALSGESSDTMTS